MSYRARAYGSVNIYDCVQINDVEQQWHYLIHYWVWDKASYKVRVWLKLWPATSTSFVPGNLGKATLVHIAPSEPMFSRARGENSATKLLSVYMSLYRSSSFYFSSQAKNAFFSFLFFFFFTEFGRYSV